MNKGQMLLRSFMFLPAHNVKYIESALRSDADALILDLEDAVPKDRRKEARENIKVFAGARRFENKKIFVRINHIGTEDFVDDIEETTMPEINGFMPSKIMDREDIVFIDRLLAFFEIKKHIPQGHFCLAPLIEETGAIENVAEIAGASDRLIALCLGGEDYLNDLGCMYTYQHSALAYARATLVNAARAHGLLPVDTPYLDISDTEGFENSCRESFINGFAGSLILNPKQIEPANRGYLPSAEKIEHSKRVIQVIQQANQSGISGVAMLDGAMVGPPMAKRAENVLKLVKLANEAI